MFQIVEIRKMEQEKEESSIEKEKSKKQKDADDSNARRNSTSSQPCEQQDSRNESSVTSATDDKPLGYSIMLRFSNAIEIRTSEDGFNSGRSYYVKVIKREPLILRALIAELHRVKRDLAAKLRFAIRRESRLRARPPGRVACRPIGFSAS